MTNFRLRLHSATPQSLFSNRQQELYSHQSEADSDTGCPVTGKQGRLLRTFSGDNLFNSYASYFGKPLPGYIRTKYFSGHTFREYQCDESGLRWYSPKIIAEADFYRELRSAYEWYYRAESWDKDLTIEFLKGLQVDSFVDYGCGDGGLLISARKHGIVGWGIDIVDEVIAECKELGFEAYKPDRVPPNKRCEVVVSLQTIEHLLDPLGFVKELVESLNPRVLLLAAPCFEGLLGHTRDPLSWPPHHVTAWSEQGFKTLAERAGLTLVDVYLEPLTPARAAGMLRMEGSATLWNLPQFPNEAQLPQFLQQNAQEGKKWAQCSHSILGVFKASD